MNFPITIGDGQTPAGNLVVTATSNNPALVSLHNITVSGSESNRVVSVFPAANQNSDVTIKLTVTDGDGMSVSRNILFGVSPVNDAPVFSGARNVLEAGRTLLRKRSRSMLPTSKQPPPA